MQGMQVLFGLGILVLRILSIGFTTSNCASLTYLQRDSKKD